MARAAFLALRAGHAAEQQQVVVPHDQTETAARVHLAKFAKFTNLAIPGDLCKI